MLEVSRLADLIEFQEGSVVSRTLIKAKTGSVTLFAFDRGEALSEHTTPHDALVQVIDGAAEVTVSGETTRVGAGELVMLPANEPHALRAVEPFKMVLTMIRA